MESPGHHSPSPHVRVVPLGTAGGPRWWSDHLGRPRSGIATAIVVGEDWYLVDAGAGAGQQAARAGLGLDRLRGVFITHLHSDHVVDLPALLMFSLYGRSSAGREPVAIVGPGPRGRLTPLSDRADVPPEIIAPDAAAPGVDGLVDGLLRAFATDLNDRARDGLAGTPCEHFRTREIRLPAGSRFDPDHDVSPAMEPLEVFRDDQVVVSTVLVSHHPMAPAYAFRLDAGGVSVTISGDTAPCDNVVRLARDTDLLMHEAIDLEAMSRTYDLAETGEATMDHHRRSHTTPEQAGEIASRAGARRLALHHLVPAHSEPGVWLRAAETFEGPLLVPDDLEAIDLRPTSTADHLDQEEVLA